MSKEPATLIEAVTYFQDPDNCLNFLAAHRWSDGVAVCPRCGSANVGFIASRRMWQCRTRHPLAQFSIKVGTIFEDSPLGLDKWLPAMWMIGSDRNGIALGSFTAQLESLRKLHGSCFTESGLRCKTPGWVASWAATLKLTKPSSAARRGTCTRTNVPKRSTGAGWKARPSSRQFLSAGARFMPPVPLR
jgi:hypothetical protein